MGTIAEKLTYLNTTKTMLRDSLNKFGSNILTTDTFRSYDTKLNEIYDKLPKITSTGQGLTITDVQNGLLDDFKMNGVDLQQNTTTGKNLFDKDNEIVGYVYNSSGDLVSSSNWNTNNEFKKISNNKISLSCKTTYPISFLLIEFDSNKTFIQRQQSTTTSYTFTLNNNTEYLRFCYLNNVGTHDIQLEEGSISTDYEPYTGGIPSPNPDYPQEIKVVEGRQVITDKGKNKFYLNNNYSANYEEASIEVNNNNSFILRMNKTSSNKQSPCATIEFNASYLKPNTTYTISKKNSNTGYVLNHVGSIRLYTNGSYGNFIDADEYTFTTPNAITSFKILLYLFFDNSTTGNYEITFYDIQLEENSTATDYEPYYEPVSYNIDLQLANIYLAKMPNTDYKNRIYKNNGNWYYEENVKKIVLDGSEDYYEYSINEDIIRFQPIILNDLAIPLSQYVSNNFKYLGAIAEATETGISNGVSTTNSRCFIFILKSIASNTENFKTWLSTHNTEIWYTLATPVTTQITNTTLIGQLEAISLHTGTNIITISNDNNMTPEIEITRLKELERMS